MKTNKFTQILISSFLVIGSVIALGGCKKPVTTPPDEPKEIEEVSVSSKEIRLLESETWQIKANVLPEGVNQDLLYTSNEPTIAKVDNQGLITGLKTGTATIRVVSKEKPTVLNQIKVNVVPEKYAQEQVVLKNQSTTVSLYLGDTYLTNAVVLPQQASQEVTYKMKDAKIAEVDSEGKITALSVGTTYLTIAGKEDSTIKIQLKVTVNHELINYDESFVPNDEYDFGAFTAFGVETAPGEDSNHAFNVHYQIKNTQSYIEYTLASDTTFENAIKVAPDNGYYFEDLSGTTISPFYGRNIYNTEIDGLQEKTTYQYRINQGNGTYSPVYTYTTSGGDTTSFLWLTDVHYYADNNTDGSSGYVETKAKVSEDTIRNACAIDPNINLVLSSGDLIDRGGSARTWTYYFENALESHSHLAQLSTPGNHEYYIYGTGQSDQRYFVANTAAPQNGPQSKMGDSCYTLSNRTLIVMLDNCKMEGIDDQMAWLENLLKTLDYDFSIVAMHYPVGTETLSKTFSQRLYEVFEKYSVDLALEGHMHSESYVKDYYENKTSTDPNLGTTYYTGDAAGGVLDSTWSWEDQQKHAKGYIVDVTGKTCTIRKIDAQGTIINTKTIVSKRDQEFTKETKENVLATFTKTVDPNAYSVTFSWGQNFYGNVEKVEINEVLENEISYEVMIPTPGYTKKQITGLTKGYFYQFDINIIFTDGTIEKRTEYVDFSDNINQSGTFENGILTLNYSGASSNFLYVIKYYNIYVNDTLIGTVNYLDKKDKPITTCSFDLSNFTLAEGEFTVRMEAIARPNIIMFEKTLLLMK